jgi:hypothetical protein
MRQKIARRSSSKSEFAAPIPFLFYFLLSLRPQNSFYLKTKIGGD